MEAKISRDVAYADAGGKPLLMDRFVLAVTAPAPAAILVHGGAWVAG
jgi:hypothetical protein